MPAEVAGTGKKQQQQQHQVTVTERKPDYFIGGSGRPILTSQSVKMHRSGMTDGTSNSKLNKCLYNTAIRNAGTRGTGHVAAFAGGSGGSRRGCKVESDITSIKPTTTGGRCSKSPSPMMGTLSSSPTWSQQRFGYARSSAADGPARTTTIGSHGGSCWSSSAIGSSNSPPPTFGISNATGLRKPEHLPRSGGGGQQLDRTGMASNRSASSRLLSTRSNMQRTSSNQPQQGAFAAVTQQCRYFTRQLDNRLTYQRSYDRNIFGYDQRMDQQLVLPPLQI